MNLVDLSAADRPTTLPTDAARAHVVVDLERRRGRELWSLARRLGLSEADAADAVQEALLRLWSELQRDRAVQDPDAWAFRVVYRIAMDEHRLARRIAAIVGRLPRPQSQPPPDATARLVVWAAVDRLPERQRAVLYLRYRADLSFEQIGHAMEITPSAARSYATVAVARLRTVLGASIGDL